MRHRRGDKMIVRARAEKIRVLARMRVLVCQTMQRSHHFHFGKRGRQIYFRILRVFRNVVEQIVNGIDADGLEHLSAVDIGDGDETVHMADSR